MNLENARKDYVHKLSNWFVNENQVIAGTANRDTFSQVKGRKSSVLTCVVDLKSSVL